MILEKDKEIDLNIIYFTFVGDKYSNELNVLKRLCRISTSMNNSNNSHKERILVREHNSHREKGKINYII